MASGQHKFSSESSNLFYRPKIATKEVKVVQNLMARLSSDIILDSRISTVLRKPGAYVGRLGILKNISLLFFAEAF
jgi:hypothetical protein